MKTRPQGGGFRVSFRSGSLGPVSEVHAVAYLSPFWRKPKTRSFGSLLEKPNQQLKESLSYLVLEFLLDALWFLEGELSAQVEKLNLTIYMYMLTYLYF